MSSMIKKFKKNKMIDVRMSIKFKCNNCNFERLVPKEEFDKMTNDTFKNNKLFFCDNCNCKMYPATIEVDY